MSALLSRYGHSCIKTCKCKKAGKSRYHCFVSFKNSVGVEDYCHEIFVKYVKTTRLVVPAWTAGTQVYMDVSEDILRAWMLAIHAGMTEATTRQNAVEYRRWREEMRLFFHRLCACVRS